MIDWHSHILPALDDGSRDIKESVLLVNKLSQQGIDTVIATPHFYANDETVESFLQRRQQSFETLKSSLGDDAPDILLGAEVRYYPGINKMAELKRLRIQGSKLLLLEMQMSKWTEYTVKELVELNSSGGVSVVLAHVERYFGLQSPKTLDRLYESGILMQANASYFISPLTRRKAIRELEGGRIHFIGSDCHNTVSRPPQFDAAFENITKKLGHRFIGQMNEYGYGLLEKINI